jgi:alginate O-acetyltransferase complex protein AlgJ
MSENTQQQTREQVAREEAGHTAIRPRAALVLTCVFLLVCAGVPLFQMAGEWSDARSRGQPFRPQERDLFRRMPDVTEPFRAKGLSIPAIVEANRLLLGHLTEFENRLDDESRLGQWIRPILQSLLSGHPGVGNEKAYIGRDGWLFYRPDMDYLTGPGFLDPRHLARRAGSGSEWKTPPLPDPRPAILDFKRQLDKRGILLVVMPTPVKPGIHAERFVPSLAGIPRPLHNRSYADFIRTLEQDGVLVFDPSDLLVRRKLQTGMPQYLATDTHWRPEAMEAVAQELAHVVQAAIARRQGQGMGEPGPGATPIATQPLEWKARGDIALMLDLPADQTLFPPETVQLRQVLDGKSRFWRSSETADVLVLGDSFSNIYSMEAMGWGESAGFVEQFASYLGRPVDRLVRNDGGAFATRDMLRRELARGRDRLEGKRVVVWQFAARELAEGDWRMITMERQTPPETAFVVPPSGETIVVSGIVREVSPAPRPGSVPYREHIVAIHLVDLPDNGEAIVYMRSMAENTWTRAARLRNGEEITVRLQRWADVATRFDGINRSELDNMELQLQEPCWGEWAE